LFFFRQYYGKLKQTIIISGLILTLAYIFVIQRQICTYIIELS